MTIILFISILIYLFSLLLAFLQKGKIERSVRIMAAGTLCVAILLLCPVIINYNITAGEDERIPIVTVLFSVLQLGSLDGDYSFWITESSNISSIYKIFMIIVCYSMPLIFGGFILSLFDGYVTIIKYKIFKSLKHVYYFSELNAHSLALAESISNKDKKSLLVFYDSSNADDFADAAAAKGFLVLSYSLQQIIQKPNHLLQFFMIKKDQAQNLPEALQILNLFKKKYSAYSGLENITISIFSEAKEAEAILNSTDKKDITVNLIKSYQKIANNLLFHYPLYEATGWNESKNLSILIIGAGTLGRAIIKNMVWCCQFGKDYRTEINIIDKDSDNVKSILEHECPEFFNPKWGLNLNFYKADVSSSEFDRVLKDKCLKTNYAVVCLNDDEISISTAIFLRQFFIFKDKNFSNEPLLAVRISDDEKFKSIKELTAINREKISLKGWDIYSSKSENYNLLPFGSNNEIYTYESIVDNELDKLALNAHAAYQNMFSDKKVPEKIVRRTYNHSEIDKKSNLANVLHVRYKLKMLGYEIKERKLASKDEIQKSSSYLEELKQIFKDEAKMEYLGRMEHDRWLAFQISEGWRSVSISEAKCYSEKTGSHKNIKAKLHPCICSWDDLDDVVKIFDPHLKEYDAEFVKLIPDILGLQDSDINVSGNEYILIK